MASTVAIMTTTPTLGSVWGTFSESTRNTPGAVAASSSATMNTPSVVSALSVPTGKTKSGPWLSVVLIS